MNEKSLTTLASMKYPKGTRLTANEFLESFPSATIIGYTSDGRYKVDCVHGESFDATDWYLETYYTIEIPNIN